MACGDLLAQGLIDKVTENNESPAPGWALDQMARLTIQKPGIELEMVELLYKRLSKNACDVKLKTLRAMHFIARRGSVAFRRAMQRGSQVIRQHLSTHPNPLSRTVPLRYEVFARLRLPAVHMRAALTTSLLNAAPCRLLCSHPGQPAPNPRRRPVAPDP